MFNANRCHATEPRTYFCSSKGSSVKGRIVCLRTTSWPTGHFGGDYVVNGGRIYMPIYVDQDLALLLPILTYPKDGNSRQNRSPQYKSEQMWLALFQHFLAKNRLLAIWSWGRDTFTQSLEVLRRKTDPLAPVLFSDENTSCKRWPYVCDIKVLSDTFQCLLTRSRQTQALKAW